LDLFHYDTTNGRAHFLIQNIGSSGIEFRLAYSRHLQIASDFYSSSQNSASGFF